MLLRIGGIVCGAAVVATIAFAQTPAGMPDYDVETHCKRQSSVMGGGDFWMKACLMQEQEAYDQLKTAWDKIPERAKKQCRQQASIMGSSYFWLNACVAQEAEANEAVKNFKFKK
jgi:hypothetical protein